MDAFRIYIRRPYFPRQISEWLYATDVLYDYLHPGHVGSINWVWKKVVFTNKTLYEHFNTAQMPRFLKFLLKLLNRRVSRLDYPVESLECFQEKSEKEENGHGTFINHYGKHTMETFAK